MDVKEIYKKIPLIMSEIGAIGKDRKNPQQGYSFRGIDDIYNAVNAALSRHGVFCAPQVEDMKREERASKQGGVLFYTILTIKYTFFAADGSSVEVRTIGEAMDSGDKSANKAMSAAQKYAFLQLFCIPTEEPKDTEEETHHVALPKAKTGWPSPATATVSTKNFEFLQVMGKEKKRVGDADYYRLLGSEGYTKSDQITLREAQEKVYKLLKDLPDAEEVG